MVDRVASEAHSVIAASVSEKSAVAARLSSNSSDAPIFSPAISIRYGSNARYAPFI